MKILTGNDLRSGAVTWWTGKGWSLFVDDAVDCPVEVPASLMGLCGFLGDLPCWMPRGAVIGGKGAVCDWAPAFPIV